jgi:hypothetical protein
MNPTVVHEAAANRFSAVVEGQRCLLDYRLHGNVMTIVHTEVPSDLGGRGIAAALVQAAFEHARSAGWRVVPACSYAASFALRHPEHADLLVTETDQ